MPRSARVVMDGGTYHVLTRGNNGQQVFHQEADYQRYLQLLAAYARRHAIKIYHFALMPNHVHLVVEVPIAAELSKAMLGLNVAYAWVYRKRHRYSGHLWQGRFKSLLIDRDSYLLECGRYVELNAVRAGLTKNPAAYAWSSYRVYAEGQDNPLISLNPLYEALGATARDRQERYRQFIHDGIRHEPSEALTRYRFIGGTTASMKSFEEQFGVPGIRRGRGRPKKGSAENRSVPIFSNRGSDEK